ncbi:MAG: integration host factor subunit alpha [Acidithiobacillus sp.]
MTVTKQKLADRLADSTWLTGRESKALVESLFDTIRATLAQGSEVKLSGFGNFTLREKAPRPGRNPKTGMACEISARRIVAFHASQILRERCDRRAASKNPDVLSRQSTGL